MTQIILVRHGQTEWDRVERFRGRADVPLNEVGVAQAEAAGRRIAAEWQPTAVYSSPLPRAVQTAEAIARPLNLPVEIAPGLVDIDYGQWQGLTLDEVRQQWPREIEGWYHAPHLARIPGGEGLAFLRARAMGFVREMAAQHKGQTIVMVGHTVVNGVILSGVLDMPDGNFWRLRQDNGAISALEIEVPRFAVMLLNDTSHLKTDRS